MATLRSVAIYGDWPWGQRSPSGYVRNHLYRVPLMSSTWIPAGMPGTPCPHSFGQSRIDAGATMESSDSSTPGSKSDGDSPISFRRSVAW
jgi:hypothetical protein